MRFLIRGAGFVNKGAETMLRTVQDQLGRRFPEATFVVEREYIGAGMEPVAEVAGFEIAKQRGDLNSKVALLAQMGLSPRRAATLWEQRGFRYGLGELIKDVDAVIDISGYAYADTLGPNGMRRTLPIVEEARHRSVPYFFLPQAWGPFHADSKWRGGFREMCEWATLLYARDVVSRQELANLLGKPLSEISLAPDIAFCFRHGGMVAGEPILKTLGLSVDSRPTVCIAPNMRVYERTEGFGIHNRYLESLENICLRFLDLGANIALIPHEINPSLRQMDDRVLCELIRLKVHAPERIVSVVDQASPADLKAVISCCELMVGSRFHAILAALDSGVPAVAIGWTHKYAELMQDIGLGDFAAHYGDCSDEELGQLVESAWQQRTASKQTLKERLPSFKRAAEAVFDKVFEVLQRRNSRNV